MMENNFFRFEIVDSGKYSIYNYYIIDVNCIFFVYIEIPKGSKHYMHTRPEIKNKITIKQGKDIPGNFRFRTTMPISESETRDGFFVVWDYTPYFLLSCSHYSTKIVLPKRPKIKNIVYKDIIAVCNQLDI